MREGGVDGLGNVRFGVPSGFICRHQDARLIICDDIASEIDGHIRITPTGLARGDVSAHATGRLVTSDGVISELRRDCRALPPGREAGIAVGDGIVVHGGSNKGYKGPDAISAGSTRAIHVIALDQVRNTTAIIAVIGMNAAAGMCDRIV